MSQIRNHRKNFKILIFINVTKFTKTNEEAKLFQLEIYSFYNAYTGNTEEPKIKLIKGKLKTKSRIIIKN